MDRDDDSASLTEQVLGAYRRFRSADAAMRERVRSATAMTENELRAIQFLIEADMADTEVKPGDLTRHLGVSSASTTALLDRLERAGSIERIANPTDRRSILIVATPAGDEKVSATIGAFESRLDEVSVSLPAAARRSIADFLTALADAADSVATTIPSR